MLEDLLTVKDLVAFIQEEERGDAVDLRGEEDFFASFCNNMPSSGAGFHTLIDTEKMNVILES
jgi:hypothetical protein